MKLPISKFIFSLFFKVKTRKYGKQTFWCKKYIIKIIKQNHGFSFGVADFERGIDNNPFADKDKFNGYEEAMEILN